MNAPIEARVDITARLAEFLVQSDWSAIPPPIKHEAKRALLNWLGCALGGAQSEPVNIALATVCEFSGPAQATLLNRNERLDVPHAALINAISSNVLDFDDTHLRTVIHPSVPVASALLALAEHRRTSGSAVLHAFVLGVEAECRIGNAISPEHYDAGWHVTATCGVLGAAAACSKVLALDAEQTTHALSMAASHASGLSEMLGGMTRMLNMGHAARDGLLCACFAANGFTSSRRGIESPRGFANAFSSRRDFEEIVDGLGAGWELASNAYKPYPCGIVVHPVIDACLQLRTEHAIAPETIERVELLVHPLVLRLTGNANPLNELQGKLSVHHTAAAAFLYGTVGVREFTEVVVLDPSIVAMRARVAARQSDEMAKDAARVRVTLKNGTQYDKSIAHAKGSIECPLSDDELEVKFAALAEWGGCGGKAESLMRELWSLDTAPDASVLARMTARV